MIEHLELSNFTAFSKLSIDFSPKINVIIGENGTGKTHLLKAAYGLCRGGNQFKSKDRDELEVALTTQLVRLFMPLDEKLGKLRHHGVTENAQLKASFKFDKSIAISFHTNSKTLSIQQENGYQNYSWEPVFFPTKEVLSFMLGFNSLYQKYELSFDQGYHDICLLLDLPKIRQEMLHEKSKWAIAEIETMCGGRFIFHGGGKVTFKTKSEEYSANTVAEGFRKMGTLSRLLETGAIQPGVSGSLFWDEPESNMNPKLMKLLVQILLELSRNGQQIILATHDYILLKWFDLLMDEGKGDHVRFHALYRDVDSSKINVKSVDAYQQLNINAIAATFSELYDSEINRSFGGKSK